MQTALHGRVRLRHSTPDGHHLQSRPVLGLSCRTAGPCRAAWTIENTAPPSAATRSNTNTLATRAEERNKSHRVVVLTKFTNPDDPGDGSATCMFLTSFGGRLDLNTSIPNSRNRLKYISVNSTPQPPAAPYSSIPISVKSLHGYVNFVSEYELPVESNDKAIVRMREAGKGGADIHSPDWVIRYIRKLKVAWVDWMLQGAMLDQWQDIATAITLEFGQPIVAAPETGAPVASTAVQDGGVKRLRDEEDEETEKVEGKGKGLVKRSRIAARWVDGAGDFDDCVNAETSDNHGSRGSSEWDELGGADQVGDDSGIQLIDSESDANPVINPLNLQTEIKIQKDRVKPESPIWAPPTPLRVEFSELHGDDEEDIDDEVDFSLLDALFRPLPKY